MAVCKSLLASPEEGHDLRSGAICVGAECRVGGSLGDVLLDCPQNCVGIVGIGGNIRERIATARHGGLLITPEETHSLRSRTDGIRREHSIARTGRDPVLDCPGNRLRIVGTCRYIRETADILGLRTALSTPQEGDDLRAGSGLVRGEQIVANAGGDILSDRPFHRFIVKAVVGNIVEEIQDRVVLHESCLDLNPAARHGKGVLAAALIRELEFAAVLIHGRERFQHIAAVGLDRDRTVPED